MEVNIIQNLFTFFFHSNLLKPIVGLNLFAGREQELVQYSKDKLLKKENETDIFEYIKIQLNLPDKIDPSDIMNWQHYLYSKLGSNTTNINTSDNKQLMIMNNKSIKNLKPEDKEKLQEKLVTRIIDMAKVLFGLHIIDHPSQKEKSVYRSVVSTQRKRAVIACFRMVSLHQLPRYANFLILENLIFSSKNNYNSL